MDTIIDALPNKERISGYYEEEDEEEEKEEEEENDEDDEDDDDDDDEDKGGKQLPRLLSENPHFSPNTGKRLLPRKK